MDDYFPPKKNISLDNFLLPISLRRKRDRTSEWEMLIETTEIRFDVALRCGNPSFQRSHCRAINNIWKQSLYRNLLHMNSFFIYNDSIYFSRIVDEIVTITKQIARPKIKQSKKKSPSLHWAMVLSVHSSSVCKYRAISEIEQTVKNEAANVILKH